MTASRLDFLEWLPKQENVPYIFGARGTFTDSAGLSHPAFDCSGLVICGLLAAGGPDWRVGWWTERLWRELPAVTELEKRPGDIVLYGHLITLPASDGSPVMHLIGGHVMCWTGTGQVYGACGGDSRTRTLEDASARNAKVRYRSRRDYRPDFVGYRRLPFDS